MTKLTYNGLPLDPAERGAKILWLAIEDQAFLSMNRLSVSAMEGLKDYVENICNYWDYDAGRDLERLVRTAQILKEENFEKSYEKEWHGYVGAEEGVQYWDRRSVLYHTICISALRKEIEFRLSLVSICERFIIQESGVVVRQKNIQRRISMKNFHWPFVLPGPTHRIRRKRPTTAVPIVSDFKKKMQQFLDVKDVI